LSALAKSARSSRVSAAKDAAARIGAIQTSYEYRAQIGMNATACAP
jgi:hypothetical protein